MADEEVYTNVIPSLRGFVLAAMSEPLGKAASLLENEEPFGEVISVLNVELEDAIIAAVQEWIRQPGMRTFMYDQLASAGGMGGPMFSVQRGLAAKAGEL